VLIELKMLGQNKAQLLNTKAARRFQFEQTQHRIGGFGKAPGDPPGLSPPMMPRSKLMILPDIYHSYLGLATLAIMKEPGIKPLDSALCVSLQQKQIINKLRDGALSR
jgi:geranylgeranyl transferase type-1 subunit beta